MPGTYSKIYTAVTGDTITAARWNAEHDNHINNCDFSGLGDYSVNTAQMQSTADPYPSSTESLATDGKGELERMRYQILGILQALADDATQWYHDYPTTGTFKIGIVGSNEVAVTINNSTSTGMILKLQDNGTDFHTFADGGAVVFNENGADADFRIEGDTEINTFYLDASADAVGIGIATPSARLHVLGNSSSGVALYVNNNTSTGNIVTFADAGVVTHTFADGGGVVFNEPGSDADFRIEGDTEINTFFLDASADSVGIGIATPSARLHVLGNASSGVALYVNNNTSTGNILTLADAGVVTHTFADGGAVVLNEPGNDADTRVEGDSDQNLIFVDASADKVGIGTSSPGQKLHVNGNLQIGDAIAVTSAQLQVAGSIHVGGGNRDIFNVGNNSLSLGVNNAMKMIINATGDIGLGGSAAGAGVVYYTSGGGVQVGGATGGDKGSGSINVSADIYKNNTAYTNPDYVFEWWATGKIEKFKNNPGAENYPGVMPLDDLEVYVREHFDLPRVKSIFVDGGGQGVFARSEIALEKIEELAIYIMGLHKRVKALEAR